MRRTITTCDECQQKIEGDFLTVRSVIVNTGALVIADIPAVIAPVFRRSDPNPVRHFCDERCLAKWVKVDLGDSIR